ncbi:unnamed protein product [Dracunculus medinensis]|uniref:G_PROTEIN_RECEP_F1_2 domain-containing protein n=1 Tax=Dracunculus medinensis TaxID=318479 RepID=A0A0N4U0L7_DRAME|nr:unnamed protein product [Dracunculus medinensis]
MHFYLYNNSTVKCFKKGILWFIFYLALFRSHSSAYAPVHGYICVAICAFGIVTNLVHVLVLSRPNMRCSAVNCVLTAVAICDMGTMASYLIYICHFVLVKNPCSPMYSHLWVQFLLWHVVFSIALHTTSLWLVVAMAFIRRMTLKRTMLNSGWQQPKFAWKVCLAVYASVFVLCVPTLLVHDIIEYSADWRPPTRCASSYPENYTAKLYTLHVPESATANGCRFFKLNLWMSGIIFKVIPCGLLFFLSIGIVLKLHETRMKRKKLLDTKKIAAKKHSRKTDRTTAMLLAILVVFLITELPQGILAILNAIYTTHVHMYIYFHLGDILDLLSLLNSSINFVLYCVMSSRYRNTFWTVVLPSLIYK